MKKHQNRKKRMKYPYGESNFGFLIKEGYHYVDKTNYIEELEDADENFIIFLRPRRFGKSLFISVLEHYYGVQYEKDFNTLFGKFYIGKKPTLQKNNYWILKFNFSGLNTKTKEETEVGFLKKVKHGIDDFIYKYLKVSRERIREILKEPKPNLMLGEFFQEVKKHSFLPIYILIDEYDHFANELMAFDFVSFQESISRNGYVRKFYEVIKTGVDDGLIRKIFITGVAPVTVDGLTSGFNIAKKFGRRYEYNEMMGFTEKEVIGLLRGTGIKDDISVILNDLRKWYDGYLFNREATEKMYNSDMVLYFLTEYQRRKKYPDELIDTNIATDYSKLRNLFALKTPIQNYKILEDLVAGKRKLVSVVSEFSFERPFNEDDFLSLLYYLGFLTIKNAPTHIVEVKIPNYVIQKLYFDFFISRLIQRQELLSELPQLKISMLEMAYEGQPELFFQRIEQVLKNLSRRDFQNFNEKHIKTIFMALAIQVNIYHIKSEREYQGGYTDIVFLQRAPYQVSHQYIIELKYLKKEQEKELSKIQKKAKEQLLDYVNTDAELQTMKNLQAWTVVVVKDKVVRERIQ